VGEVKTEGRTMMRVIKTGVLAEPQSALTASVDTFTCASALAELDIFPNLL